MLPVTGPAVNSHAARAARWWCRTRPSRLA